MSFCNVHHNVLICYQCLPLTGAFWWRSFFYNFSKPFQGPIFCSKFNSLLTCYWVFHLRFPSVTMPKVNHNGLAQTLNHSISSKTKGVTTTIILARVGIERVVSVQVEQLLHTTKLRQPSAIGNMRLFPQSSFIL